LRGNVTAVQRTWLARYGARKAPIEDPRRSLGHQLGSGVRLGLIDDVLTVGEGLETMLSLRSVLPQMPMLAGLSANHLAALELPFGLRRLYVARDNDAEGRRAETRLRERIQSQGVDVCALQPAYADFNVDLRRFGPGALRERIARQLVPEGRERFAVSQADFGRLMVRPLRDSRGCSQSSSDRKIGRAPRAAFLRRRSAPEALGRTSRPERGRNGVGRLLSLRCGLLAEQVVRRRPPLRFGSRGAAPFRLRL
jgi:hypothetical protein